jgi:NTP pyrophosphatase (non-canonical NTP hydrolase)
MEFNEFQKKCRLTDLGTSAQDCLSPGWLYYVLGAAEETGEMVGKIKKLFRDRNGIVDDEFRSMLTKEMGDIQWYLARLADQFDIEFNNVAKENINKLLSRLERGKLHGDGDER